MDFQEGLLYVVNLINNKTDALACQDGKKIIIRTPEGNQITVKVEKAS